MSDKPNNPSTTTHPAIVLTGLQQPLATIQIPTPVPVGNEVKVLVEWTCSTPFDLHQSDGGLLVGSYPQVLGDSIGGTIVEIGPDVKHFKVGDKVFGFVWQSQKEKGQQLYCVPPENLIGKLPDGFTLAQAVTLANNFVTIWHTSTKELKLELPWPKPEGYVPPEKDEWFLIWGGSSSCGMYALQILKYYGYKNLITTASESHHEKLKGYGAAVCFDYRHPDTVQKIRAFLETKNKHLGYILDCIGSVDKSVTPISQLATKGTRVPILLPIIKRDAAPGGVLTEFEFGNIETVFKWEEGVIPTGVRTHFYQDNPFLADKLQREIMPWALANGIVEPNKHIVVEGKTCLERAEKAMSMLRNKELSGARLVWRIAD